MIYLNIVKERFPGSHRFCSEIEFETREKALQYLKNKGAALFEVTEDCERYTTGVTEYVLFSEVVKGTYL